MLRQTHGNRHDNHVSCKRLTQFNKLNAASVLIDADKTFYQLQMTSDETIMGHLIQHDRKLKLVLLIEIIVWARSC